jgi:putative thioredoxin
MTTNMKPLKEHEMDVTTDTFPQDVIERSKELPVIVDFWAAWCGPCRMLGPAIESEVAKREGKIELAKIDVDAEQELAGRYGIQSIPTVVVFRDGKPVTGFVGARAAATIGGFLDEAIEEHGEAVDAA